MLAAKNACPASPNSNPSTLRSIRTTGHACPNQGPCCPAYPSRLASRMRPHTEPSQQASSAGVAAGK